MNKLTKYACILTAMAGAMACSDGKKAQGDYAIIPLPQEVVTQGSAPFLLKPSTPISYQEGDTEMGQTARFLASYIKEATGYEPKVIAGNADKSIHLSIASDIRNPEGYRLLVSENGIEIAGASNAGIFYGVQTLRKSIPAVAEGMDIELPAVSINDYPRFPYRGMHLDVSRHFFPADSIKKFIDILALHNMNTFHWHLTDDQAWRIEMKSHPELTHKGSDREGEILGLYPGTYVKRPYGGYYTQEQAREIVEYAAERYITVIPEIDIPGHCMAVLAVHPEFGTEPDKEHKTAQTWGIYNKFNNVLAPKPEVFAFLEDVFSELCDIFPSQYIHVGGDECAKKWWKESAQAQQFMKDNNLKDEDELQSYFIHYVGDVINKKGKTVVGWNEILEGGLAPDAIVMSWQGTSGGITAAKSGHRVIMTPSGYSYYNNMQSRNQTQVTHQGYLPVDKVYGYQVIPDELTKDQAGNIIGVQACLWTEYFPTTAKVEWALFPRLSALAENAWSQPDVKGWDKFLRKMPSQFERYDLWGVRYSDDFFRMYDVKKNDPTTR